MTFSNPLSFKPPGNFNPNGQNFNPNAQIFNPTSQNSNQNYAAQLQEQFFNLTKFCSESTYIPNKKNSDIDEKELLEEKVVLDYILKKFFIQQTFFLRL